MRDFQFRAMFRAAAFCLPALMITATTASASDATGVWINDTGRGAVEIKPCGGALCGHVVWVKDGGDAKGCGRQIIGDAQPIKSGLWDNGWIYSPERKKRYDVELKPLDNDRLRVTGYAGSKFFSKAMIWKRAPDDLVRCGTATVAKANAAPAADSKPAPAAESNAAPAAENKPAPAADAKPAAQAEPTKVETAAAAPAPAETAARLSPEAKLRAEMRKEEDAKAAEAKAAETQVAEAEDDSSTAAKADGIDLGNLKLDKYLKRDNGSCQLDLPWVKVDFKCPE